MPKRTDAARLRWLQVGEDLLNEHNNDVQKLLTIQAICEKAGRYPNAFTNMFKTIDNYVSELLKYLTHTERFPSVGELHDGLLALKDTDQLLEGIRAFLRADFEIVLNTPVNGTLYLLMSGKPSNKTMVGLKTLYRSFDANLAPVLEEVMMAWNREPTPPLTSLDMAVMFNALIEGWVMRARFDPERANPALYTQIVLCLLPMVTRECGESVTIDDRVVVLNSYRKETLDTK